MASEDIAARGDASKRVRLLQLTLGTIVCCGPNDRKRVNKKIFLLAISNSPRPHTKCPYVCARVSHAARILERTTHFGQQLHIQMPRVDAVLSAKFSFSRTSWKGTRSRLFSNLPSRRTHFISSCTGKQSKRLEAIHESPIIAFNAHTFHGPFPCLTIFSTRYFGLDP